LRAASSAARAVPCTAGEQPEALVEQARDLARSHGDDPRGRELDRQRDAVEPAADLRDGSVGREIGPNGASPLAEQPDCVALGQRRNRILLLERQA
jgi:hypothetical protein